MKNEQEQEKKQVKKIQNNEKIESKIVTKENKKFNKGITLIALVITIVVLIILGGMSINLVLGESGLFTRARQAVEDFNQKAIEEKLQILYAEQLIDENSKNTTATKDATRILEEMVGKGAITQEDIEQFNKYLEKYNEKIIGISSKEDLKKIGTDDAYPLTGMYVQLEDIMNEEEQFTPIGTEEEPFTGVYNGNGKNIDKLTINANSENSGMFGTNTGTIKNITIENCNINSEYTIVGTVVGNNSGLIENCTVNNGELNSNSNNDKDGSQLGGICGRNNDEGMIRNCKNYANVTGNYKLVGGICGYNLSGTIENCYNYGTIIGPCQIGGITGYASGTIQNCINEKSVKSIIDDSIIYDASYIGGIVGYSGKCKITHCINKGEIQGDKGYFGGIVGYANTGTSIIQCSNLADISGKDKAIGGICGLLNYECDVDQCYNLKNISGDSYVGGLVGAVRANSHITNSYNKGNITASENLVGGLVGIAHCAIENCYNTGVITLNSSTNSYVGNLFGYVSTKDVKIEELKNCYYLSTGSGKAAGNEDEIEKIEGAIGKTNVEMQSLAKELGSEFVDSTEGDKYPKLKWQK